MNHVARIGAAMAVMSLLPACATVVRGTKTNYRVTSTPIGANVALSTGQTCTTPCKMKLDRKEGFTATMTMPGYWPVAAAVTSKVSGGGGLATAGNLLVGGVVGGVVDGSNGSLKGFFPHHLNVALVPQPSTASMVHVLIKSPGQPARVAILPAGSGTADLGVIATSASDTTPYPETKAVDLASADGR